MKRTTNPAAKINSKLAKSIRKTGVSRLCASTGISHSQINRMLKPQYNPSLRLICQVAKATGLTLKLT